MAKEIDKIIQSKTAPKSNNVLWDDGKNLKINRNGKWETTTSNSDNITEELKDLGIEYYDVIIKSSIKQLEELTDNFNTSNVSLELMENYGKNIIEGLKKANKALNVYFIMDNTLFTASFIEKSDNEYPGLICFGETSGIHFGFKISFAFYEHNFTISYEEL